MHQSNIRTKRTTITKMLRHQVTMTTLVSTIILISALLTKQIKASGVFELELIKFQHLNNLHQHRALHHQPVKIENNSSTNSRTVEQPVTNHHQQQQNEDSSSTNLLRVLVCLKEAFTSQLDGPCTFGNASITLSADSQIQTDSLNLNQPTSTGQQANFTVASGIQLQHQQGFSTTNIVRILFTFRWTVSC